MSTTANARQRILDSARDLIYAHSYADVGVAAICERAAVNKGSFYHFFASKRELTVAVLEEFRGQFSTELWGRAFAPHVPPLERFDRFVEALYEFHKGIAGRTERLLGCPFGNLAAELATQDDVIRGKVDSVFRDLEAYFRETLQLALDGEDLKQVDVAATAEAMLAFLEGVLLLAKTRNDPEVIRRLGPAVGDILVTSEAD